MSRRTGGKARVRCVRAGCANLLRKSSAREGSGFCSSCCYEAKRAIGNQWVTADEIVAYYTTTDKIIDAGKSKGWQGAADVALSSAQAPTDYKSEFDRVLKGDWAIAADIHVPFHHPLMLIRMMQTAELEGIDQLLVPGDLVDLFEISRFPSTTAKRTRVIENFMQAFQVLGVLCWRFKKIVVLKGNHEARLEKLMQTAAEQRTGSQAKMIELLDIKGEDAKEFGVRYEEVWTDLMAERAKAIAGKVEFSRAWQIQVEGPVGHKPWRIMHQRSYSRRPPYEGKHQWERFTQPILTTHTHHFGCAVAPNGVDVLVNLGAMCAPEKMRYKQEADTGYPEWVNGFGMIKGGALSRFVDNPYLTNWGDLAERYSRAVKARG